MEQQLTDIADGAAGLEEVASSAHPGEERAGGDLYSMLESGLGQSSSAHHWLQTCKELRFRESDPAGCVGDALQVGKHDSQM